VAQPHSSTHASYAGGGGGDVRGATTAPRTLASPEPRGIKWAPGVGRNWGERVGKGTGGKGERERVEEVVVVVVGGGGCRARRTGGHTATTGVARMPIDMHTPWHVCTSPRPVATHRTIRLPLRLAASISRSWSAAARRSASSRTRSSSAFLRTHTQGRHARAHAGAQGLGVQGGSMRHWVYSTHIDKTPSTTSFPRYVQPWPPPIHSAPCITAKPLLQCPYPTLHSVRCLARAVFGLGVCGCAGTRCACAQRV
jgi:hypothetical protein